MQSVPGSSSSVGNRNSNRGSDSLVKRTTVYADRSKYEQPPSPSRIVVAEGSEFVLQPVPTRGSPSSSSSPSATRRVLPPHPSAAASSPSRPHTQPRAASTTVTPPRSRQAERPYRPPPSSSARFYERQQQLWLLQQTCLSPSPDSGYTVSKSQQSYASGSSRFSTEHALSHTGVPHLQPTSASYSSAENRVQASPTAHSTAFPESTAPARSRAPSVSSLAPPVACQTVNRARSGSDTGSFTRSCISSGYQSHTDDDDSLDYDTAQRSFAAGPQQPELLPTAGSAASTLAPFLGRPTPEHELAKSRLPLAASTSAPSSVALNGLEDSVDANWDAELGILEAGHAAPLRLPMVQPGNLLRASSTVAGHSTVVKPHVISNRLVVSNAPIRTQAESHLRGPHATDLKGIRVTSSVRESWDDDFLFQTEEAALGTPRQGSPDSSRTASERNRTRISSSSRHLHPQNRQDEEEDDDVENWDDAFSWNADSHLTPSASNTSPLRNSVRASHENTSPHGNSSTVTEDRRSSWQLLPDVRRHLDFASTAISGISKKRLSNASSASDGTDLSARLAAQSDAELRRLSRDSGDSSRSDQLAASIQRNAHGLANSARNVRHEIDSYNDGSGDDTETETPPSDAVVPVKNRSGRRSLGAALGFDTSRKATANSSTISTRSSPHSVGGTKDELDSVTAKFHTRSQSRSKLGALQRLSFSRSRVNVANASSTSVNAAPETDDSPIKMFSDNRSQASLLSQVSTSSNRSRPASSPTSLKRSYAALRSTSIRRLLGRSVQSSAHTSGEVRSPRTPPSTPPRRRSELTGFSDAMCSPPTGKVSTNSQVHSMSPPSAWTTSLHSSEATPTRPKDQSNRRGSDSLHRQWSSPVSRVGAGSPTQSPSFGTGFTQKGEESLFADYTVDEASLEGGTAVSKGVRDQAKRPDLPLTVGLRREPSSSNTLRTKHKHGAEVRLAPSKSGRDSSRGSNSVRHVHPVHRKNQPRVRSDEALVDDWSMASTDLSTGEELLRGSDERGLASRSVSASTAYSYTSNESMYGYRMRKEISVSSGYDAQDSETSYGTSVGSSPGISNPSSSGWLTHSKRGAAPSTDTRDTAWTASADLSSRHGTPSKVDDRHSRATSMPGSPLCLEHTLDGTASVILQCPPNQPIPGTSLSPQHHGEPSTRGSVRSVSPTTPSKGAPTRIVEASRNKRGSSAGNTGVLLATNQTTSSSAASQQKTATRRNSLSDLKIPSRISKAQDGLRNNINLVRDFAKGIEELKSLKASYMHHRVKFPLSSSDIENRVQNWLECADVLIGLGEGRSESDSAVRADTVSHTPLFTRVDSRRTTFSDVSSYSSPRSPLEDTAAGKASLSATRSVSGTSQGTTSTTDGGRSVDVQREIDILSAILGGTKINSPSQAENRPHGRFQSDSYTLHELPSRNGSFTTAPASPAVVDLATGKDVSWSSLATADRKNMDDKRSGMGGALGSDGSQRPFNPASNINAAGSSPTDAAPYDGIDVDDPNRSAKRRLRSASRAGLQGLRELLKVFKGAAGDDSAVSSSKTTATFQSSTGMNLGETGGPVDGVPLTPPVSKQKRRSLNLKRRSFLRSKASLESIQAKNTDGTTGSRDEALPPPVAADAGRYSRAMRKGEQRKLGPPSSKSSLDITLETLSASPLQDDKEFTKAIPRDSFHPALNSKKRRSVDTSVQRNMQHSTDTKPTQRPTLAVQPQLRTTTNTVSSDPRRASTSVDSMHHRAIETGRPHTSMESPPNLQASTVQKLTLRPEAMPGLLVYVQATKQHLQAAIESLAPTTVAGYERA